MLIAGVPYLTDVTPKFALDKGVATLLRHPSSVALSDLISLGEYFQVQDDFLDFSAPPQVLGKLGTDIVDNKCSWVVDTALNVSSPSASSNPFNPSLAQKHLAELRKTLEENYSRKDVEKEKRVKEVFKELGVRDTYGMCLT